MANLMDYLDWRGDIPFSFDPFNEVDNIILSELCYTDFDGIVPQPGEGTVAIDEVCDRFFALHTEEELLSQDTAVKRAPFMLKKMKGSARYGKMRIGGYVNLVSGREEEQMSAVTFYLEDDSIYVAYRGTDNTIVGWKEDFNISFMPQTAGQHHAAEYLSRTFATETRPLRIGGHSKGGNFAVYAAAFCDHIVNEKIIQVWTNDGPGFLEEIVASEAYQRLLPRIISIVPTYSVFGLLLNCEYPHKVVVSDGKGIWQHDALSWQVERNHFVEAEDGLCEDSLFLEKTIDTWVAGFSLEERGSFVNLMYELFLTSGAETVSEFNAERMKNYFGMLKAYRAMTPEEQRVVSSTLGALVKSGVDTFVSETKETPPAPPVNAAGAAQAVSSWLEKIPLSWHGKSEKGKDKEEEDIVDVQWADDMGSDV